MPCFTNESKTNGHNRREIMKVSDIAEPLAPNLWTILPVTRWGSVQSSPANRQRVRTVPAPLPYFRMISEAHVSEREAAFVRCIWSFRRAGRSRAGVRFHTKSRSQADTW